MRSVTPSASRDNHVRRSRLLWSGAAIVGVVSLVVVLALRLVDRGTGAAPTPVQVLANAPAASVPVSSPAVTVPTDTPALAAANATREPATTTPRTIIVTATPTRTPVVIVITASPTNTAIAPNGTPTPKPSPTATHTTAPPHTLVPPTQTAIPTAPSPRGRIAYLSAASREDADWAYSSIHLMKADGSERSVITGYGREPMLSAGGSALVCISMEHGGIVRLDLTTWETRQITPSATESLPTISSDGLRISYWSRGDTYVWEGGNAHQVEGLQTHTHWNHAVRTRPSWSPDGHWLAYGAIDGIYKITAVGGIPVKVVDNGDAPAWSVAGRIAFVRDGDIYSVRDDGTDLTQLTDHPAGDYDPAWSPDGAWLLFVSERDGNAELYVLSINGGKPIRLSNTPEWEGWPSWSW